jgi:hypothetical protein
MKRSGLIALACGLVFAVGHGPLRAAVVPGTIVGSGTSGFNATALAFVQGKCSASFVNDPANGADALVLDVGQYLGRHSVNLTWKTPVPNPTGYLQTAVYSAGPTCASVGTTLMILPDSGTVTVPLPANGKWLVVGSQGRLNTTISLS